MINNRGVDRSIALLEILVLTGMLCALPVDSAHAYLDPGSGSMLLQLLLGGVAGIAVIFKLYWAQFKEGIQKIFGSKTNDDSKDV